jgi:hypothetical protein
MIKTRESFPDNYMALLKSGMPWCISNPIHVYFGAHTARSTLKPPAIAESLNLSQDCLGVINTLPDFTTELARDFNTRVDNESMLA